MIEWWSPFLKKIHFLYDVFCWFNAVYFRAAIRAVHAGMDMLVILSLNVLSSSIAPMILNQTLAAKERNAYQQRKGWALSVGWGKRYCHLIFDFIDPFSPPLNQNLFCSVNLVSPEMDLSVILTKTWTVFLTRHWTALVTLAASRWDLAEILHRKRPTTGRSRVQMFSLSHTHEKWTFYLYQETKALRLFPAPPRSKHVAVLIGQEWSCKKVVEVES